MKKKTAYRIRNWREYNRALKQRGSLTVWISKDALAN
ncbi:MAG: IS5/IS1182 family transposase, partial [Blastocatellia bacterium]